MCSQAEISRDEKFARPQTSGVEEDLKQVCGLTNFSTQLQDSWDEEGLRDVYPPWGEEFPGDPLPQVQPPWGKEFPSKNSGITLLTGLAAVSSNAYVHGNYQASPPPTVFYYSGHGGQTKVLDGSYNDVIYPADFCEVGHIDRDEIRRIMMTPLQPSIHLTTIVDSCHPNSDGGSSAELLNFEALTRHEGIKIHSQFSTEEMTFSWNDTLTQHMRVVQPSHTLLDGILVSPQQKPEAVSNNVSSPYVPPLLPASAAAFARRTSVSVVLGSKVEPWLTETLKRISQIRRPLNSVLQHQNFLTETLSSADAIWTLTSIMLRKTPDSGLHKDPNPLIEALFNFQLVHIEAYVVHVDMVQNNEVAFKLTPDSIKALTDYHKEIHCNIAASTCNYLKRDLVEKLHDKFIKDINKFVYQTNATALEGLEEEGVGELMSCKSNEVKSNIMNLFLPLLPPPLSYQTPASDKDYGDSNSSLGQTPPLNLHFPLSPFHTTTTTAGQPSQLRDALPSKHKKCERIMPSGKRCNAEFSRIHDLTRHENTIHNALRKIIRCQFCSRTYTREDCLKRHIRGHIRDCTSKNRQVTGECLKRPDCA